LVEGKKKAEELGEMLLLILGFSPIILTLSMIASHALKINKK
jgi:hypothetical protein